MASDITGKWEEVYSSSDDDEDAVEEKVVETGKRMKGNGNEYCRSKEWRRAIAHNLLRSLTSCGFREHPTSSLPGQIDMEVAVGCLQEEHEPDVRSLERHSSDGEGLQ